jgi:hypothetical protein
MMVMVKAFGYGAMTETQNYSYQRRLLGVALPMRELRKKWWNYVTYYVLNPESTSFSAIIHIN